AEVAAEADAVHVPVPAGEVADDVPRAVAAAVVHEDDLQLEARVVRDLGDLLVEVRQAILLVVDRDDDGDHGSINRLLTVRAPSVSEGSADPSLTLGLGHPDEASSAGSHSSTAPSTSSAAVHTARSSSTAAATKVSGPVKPSRCSRKYSRTPIPLGATRMMNPATYARPTAAL